MVTRNRQSTPPRSLGFGHNARMSIEAVRQRHAGNDLAILRAAFQQAAEAIPGATQRADPHVRKKAVKELYDALFHPSLDGILRAESGTENDGGRNRSAALRELATLNQAILLGRALYSTGTSRGTFFSDAELLDLMASVLSRKARAHSDQMAASVGT